MHGHGLGGLGDEAWVVQVRLTPLTNVAARRPVFFFFGRQGTRLPWNLQTFTFRQASDHLMHGQASLLEPPATPSARQFTIPPKISKKWSHS